VPPSALLGDVKFAFIDNERKSSKLVFVLLKLMVQQNFRRGVLYTFIYPKSKVIRVINLYRVSHEIGRAENMRSSITLGRNSDTSCFINVSRMCRHNSVNLIAQA
jgi:hypothetical protein